MDNFQKRLQASESAQLAEMKGDHASAARFRDDHRRLCDELEPARPAAAAVPVPAARPQASRFAHLFGGSLTPTPKAPRPAAKAATANRANDKFFGK
jgi:hypothetical protein